MKWLAKARQMAESVGMAKGCDIAQFENLYLAIASQQDWDSSDYREWRDDFTHSPKLTIDCLLALKRSWEQGRNGYLIPQDWEGSI